MMMLTGMIMGMKVYNDYSEHDYDGDDLGNPNDLIVTLLDFDRQADDQAYDENDDEEEGELDIDDAQVSLHPLLNCQVPQSPMFLQGPTIPSKSQNYPPPIPSSS